MTNIQIKGIASGLHVAGIGLLKWSIRDDDNNEVDLHIRNALYVPQAPMGLLCPQQIAQQTQKPGDGFTACRTFGIFTFDGFRRTVPYDTRSRLPILHTIGGFLAYTAKVNPTSAPSLPNLSATQQLLPRWHNRLSHMSFGHLQELARQGRLPMAIAGCDHPICHSCQYGKAHKRSVASSGKAHPIDSRDLTPGDCVSVDQIESPSPGYIDTFKANLQQQGITQRHYTQIMQVFLCISNATTLQVARRQLRENKGSSNLPTHTV
jgi:hypothetical protein